MISIIMSTYKEPLIYIEKSMDSILMQTINDLEFIIIVDDPENIELVDYLKDRQAKDSRIKFSVNEQNCGLTESLNRAIKLATGDFVARMDADDISEPDRLECQMGFLVDNDLDLVGCNIRNMDENGDIISDGTSYPTSDTAIKDYLKTNSAIPHPTWFMKRVVCRNYLYADFPACEDYEFLARIALDGLKLGNVKEPKLRYRINSSGISANRKVHQKTSQYFVRRNYNARRKSSLEEFGLFLESAEGKKKQTALASYYEQSAKLKEYRRNKKMIPFLFCGFRILVTSSEGRNVIISVYKERRLKKRYGDSY